MNGIDDLFQFLLFLLGLGCCSFIVGFGLWIGVFCAQKYIGPIKIIQYWRAENED